MMNLKRYAFCGLGVSLLSLGLAVGCGDSNGDDNNGALPRFLFSAGDADVGAYTVDAKTGAITIVTGSPFTSGFSASPCPDLAAADPKGTLLFVPDACNDNIAVLTIDSKTGALAAATGSPFATGTGNFNVQQPVVDPSAKFLYVPEDNGP